MLYRYNCTHSPPQHPHPHTHSNLLPSSKTRKESQNVFIQTSSQRLIFQEKLPPSPKPRTLQSVGQSVHARAWRLWLVQDWERETKLAGSIWWEGYTLHERTGSLVRSIYKEAHNSDCPCNHLWPQGKSALDQSWCCEWPEVERSQVPHNITEILIIHAIACVNFSLCEILP